MNSKYEDKNNIDIIHDSLGFETYKTLTIQSIKAEYTGSTKAETRPEKTDFKVTATYQTGEERDVTSKCEILGLKVLVPEEKVVAKISIKDWNDKEFSEKVNIECSSKVKKIKAKYTGSKKGGTRINEGSKEIEVTATLDDGTEVVTSSYSLDGPSKLKSGEVNTYQIGYGGKTTTLKIKAKKNFNQLAKIYGDQAKKSKYATSGFYDKVVAEHGEMGGGKYLSIQGTLKSDIYYYLNRQRTGSDAAVTYEEILLAMSNYCADIHDKFEKNGYDVYVTFSQLSPYGNVYSLASSSGIQVNPFAD